MVGSCFPLRLVSQLGVAENIQVGVSSQTSSKSSATSQSRIIVKNSSYHFLQMTLEEGLLFSYLLNDSSTIIAQTQQCWWSRSCLFSVLCLQSHKIPSSGRLPPNTRLFSFSRERGIHIYPLNHLVSARQIQSSLGHGAAMAWSFSRARPDLCPNHKPWLCVHVIQCLTHAKYLNMS